MPGSFKDIVQDRLALLCVNPIGLTVLQRGIEKESLRITPDGNLSQKPHPGALGSPLTHACITTDFSEAQLELITGVHQSGEACLAELHDIHGFVFANLEDEMLWPASMPCLMANDEEIPIGQYGTSNIGQAKTVYRRGLGVRYGRLMQTISGIHYNFSVPEVLWQQLGITNQEQITAAYFGLIRNFRRWSWLLIYAFGASPSVCKSFTKGLQHNLATFDEGSQYLPHATSLRMGPLGYQSSAQTTLHISYNSLEEYANSMIQALTTEFTPYAEKGVIHNGQYQQLNTAILQIENEFYGTIRPKRTINSGERPVTALKSRGVEYVEVRCVDLNPFLAVGIDLEQIDFIDTFLVMCLLANAAPDSQEESKRLASNQQTVVECGRDPDIELQKPNGDQIKLSEWADELLQGCEEIAAVMDEAGKTTRYGEATAAQAAKVANPDLTPSARVLNEMAENNQPFFRFSMSQAETIKRQALVPGLDEPLMRSFSEESARSIARQAEIEAADSEDFPTFLQSYLALDR